LYADLQSNNVRCWLAPEDLKSGANIRVGMDQAIRLHDKLLLVLSKTSTTSAWVEQEVETALARERREKRRVLIPVRLDDAVMKRARGWPALIRTTRNVGDFRRWKNHDDYQQALQQLLRDLKADAQALTG
ncbi:MAG: toll/interleukin-1 receptor domain-containing protein, partial [Chloroflexota bacterium]|nr:toll/interleukin-1 receptor domain-containing protein [Chloroflexota bacterium]